MPNYHSLNAALLAPCSLLQIFISCTILLALGAQAQSTQSQLQEVDSTLKITEKSLEKSKAKRGNTRAQLNDIEKQIAERTQRHDQTKIKTKALSALADQIRIEEGALSTQLSKQKLALARLLESTYLMGRQSGLKIALSQQGTQNIARLNHYAQTLSSARRLQLKNIVQVQNQLNLKTSTLQQEQHKLETLNSALAEDQRYLSQLKRNRLSMLDKLDQSIGQDTIAVEQLRQRKTRLEALLSKITKRQRTRLANKEQQDNQARAQAKESIRTSFKPKRRTQSASNLPMPVKARIAARFGDKRSSSGLPWSGMLLQGKEGTDIRAINDGEVVYADWLQGYGQMIIIDHGNSMMSLYGHNKLIHKTVGDYVRQSDIIASMGNTAGLKKAALYFEIRQNGQAQDPLKWCRI